MALKIFESFQDVFKYLSVSDALYFAVPDLHGRLDLFEKCIESLRRIPGHVIFLGDYIDRLPSLKLVNRILEIEKERPDYVFLPGNHEWMCIEWYLENERQIGAGGLRLIPAPEGTLMQEWKEKGEVPKKQLHFFDRILRKRYHLSEQGNLLFVHAGVESSLRVKSIESMDPDHFLWSRRMPLNYQGPLLIHGHTFAGADPLIRKREVNLETRCWLETHRPLSVGVFRDVIDDQDPFVGVVKIQA